jgi:hypothetical protein
MKKTWKKIAAVTTGGKDYFYMLRDDTGLFHVVWDRIDKVWLAQENHKTLNRFMTSKAAMIWIEQQIYLQKFENENIDWIERRTPWPD